MAGDAIDRAREAAERSAWPEVYRLLRERPLDDLTATDLESLADAAWWLSRVEESLAVRRRAHAAYAADGWSRRAGYNAWMLATEYDLIGKPALAAGWLTKARRHLEDQPECVEQGYLAFVEAQMASATGDGPTARRLADHVVAIGTSCGSPEVISMGRLLQGETLIATGDPATGLAHLDETMCDVMAGGLDDLTTGWLYCLAVPLSLRLSELERATEWNAASLEWCEELPTATTPFHGLCRAHRVELLDLSGAWSEAIQEASRACEELLDYHPNTAAEAFYARGDLDRRRGDLADAEAAFLTAHELGHDPQPGLALLRLAQGRPDAAAAGLASCLAAGGTDPVARARLLAAQTQVAMASGDLEVVRAAAHELDTIAEGSGSRLLEALAATAAGTAELVAGAVPVALECLRRALASWLELGPPYETARTRTLLAEAYRALGDTDTATLEARAARSVFARLGAGPDRQRVDELLGAEPQRPGGLTPRQLEVLRLLARGRTNHEIGAELVISDHTVSRHVENIYTRLGVSSRTAATTFAHEHGLV